MYLITSNDIYRSEESLHRFYFIMQSGVEIYREIESLSYFTHHTITYIRPPNTADKIWRVRDSRFFCRAKWTDRVSLRVDLAKTKYVRVKTWRGVAWRGSAWPTNGINPSRWRQRVSSRSCCSLYLFVRPLSRTRSRFIQYFKPSFHFSWYDLAKFSMDDYEIRGFID